MKAVIATREPCVELWDLRMLAGPIATTDPRDISATGSCLQAAGLGGERPRVAFGSRRGTIHLFDASGEGGVLKKGHVLYGHQEEVLWAQFNWESQGSRRVTGASLASDDQAHFWGFNWHPGRGEESMEAGESSPSASPRMGHLDSESMEPMSARGTAATRSSGIFTRSVGQGPRPRGLPELRGGGYEPIRTVAWSQRESDDQPCAATGSRDGVVGIWLNQGRGSKHRQTSMVLAENGRLSGHTDQVCAISADFDVGVLVSGSLDRTLRVWVLEDRWEGQSRRCESLWSRKSEAKSLEYSH